MNRKDAPKFEKDLKRVNERLAEMRKILADLKAKPWRAKAVKK